MPSRRPRGIQVGEAWWRRGVPPDRLGGGERGEARWQGMDQGRNVAAGPEGRVMAKGRWSGADRMDDAMSGPLCLRYPA